MKKHNLVRAIQYLEKHYGSVDTYAEHDTIYLCVSAKEISIHRLKRLQLINLFIEDDLDTLVEEGFTCTEAGSFIFYT